MKTHVEMEGHCQKRHESVGDERRMDHSVGGMNGTLSARPATPRKETTVKREHGGIPPFPSNRHVIF